MKTIDSFLTYLELRGHSITAREFRTLIEAERANYRTSIDEALAKLDTERACNAMLVADSSARRQERDEALAKLASIAMERDAAQRELDLFGMENAAHWRDVGDIIKVAIENATFPLEERIRQLEERERTLLPKAARCDRYEAPGAAVLTEDIGADQSPTARAIGAVKDQAYREQHARDVALVATLSLEELVAASDVAHCDHCGEPPTGEAGGAPWCVECECECVYEEATERQAAAIQSAIVARLKGGDGPVARQKCHAQKEAS